ncbi:MAG: LysR substrate-binding domain-containing protein [Myxococcota bacterium]
MSIEAVATFVEAAEKGSMAAASRALGLPTSTVSRRIHRLEEELGVQLVESNARLFRLTEAGDALLRRSAAAVRDLREAMHALRDGGNPVRGQLRITAPQDLGSADVMAQLFAKFRADNPHVELLIDLGDRKVDLVAEGVDFAFRIHQGPVQGQRSLMSRRLLAMHARLFASPAYVEQHGAPDTVEDLTEHAMIMPTFGAPWTLEHVQSGETTSITMDAPVQSTSLSFIGAAARAHMGIAPIPTLIASPAVERGDLVQVLPDWQLKGARLSLLWPESRLPSPRRRTFLDFTVAHTAGWTSF